jgi:riboflavin kinase / FMN adenylyltransferase
VIGEAGTLAHAAGAPHAVLTFEPHPRSVFRPQDPPFRLTPFRVKSRRIEALGVDLLFTLHFDRAFAQRSAEDFVSGVLVDTLQATHVSVGRNFRFGHKARGDAALLAAEERFETRVCDLVEVEGETVSSSHIRGLVGAGEVEHAIAFLGRPFQVRGEVVHGDGRGRELGFATANVVPDERLVRPDMGVYACRANGVPAAINIGVRPMFETGRGILVEAHLIDFDEDLYGTELRIDFLSRLRGERMFDSVDALVEQIARDVARTRELVG